MFGQNIQVCRSMIAYQVVICRRYQAMEVLCQAMEVLSQNTDHGNQRKRFAGIRNLYLHHDPNFKDGKLCWSHCIFMFHIADDFVLSNMFWLNTEILGTFLLIFHRGNNRPNLGHKYDHHYRSSYKILFFELASSEFYQLNVNLSQLRLNLPVKSDIPVTDLRIAKGIQFELGLSEFYLLITEFKAKMHRQPCSFDQVHV